MSCSLQSCRHVLSLHVFFIQTCSCPTVSFTTHRRTFKDVINFIPFVIILIIPLSPVGHVLVFGAIQRVFPDFFPSCFTERRQNLLELYESTEYTEVTIKENWREKVARILEALGFLIVSSIKSMIASFRQSATGGLVAGEDGDDEANA